MLISDSRSPGMQILTNPSRPDSRTFVLDDTAGLVGDAADWELTIHADDPVEGVTVITPAVSVDTFANSVTFTWTAAQWTTAGLPADDAQDWSGYYRIYHDAEIAIEILGPFLLQKRGTNDAGAGSTIVAIEDAVVNLTAVAAIDASTITGPRRPLPLGSRMIPLGHSICLGSGSTLSSTTSITGDSRQAVGGWVGRLAGQHPDRFYKIRNAGVGGDPIGGLATMTAATAVGATSVTVELVYGLPPYSTAQGIYVGGYSSGEAKTPSAIVDNGDGTYTFTVTALASAHAAGAEVGWGGHGRLQANVIDWEPEMVPILYMTNDVAKVADATFTAAEVVDAVMEFGPRLRAVDIEPVFMEELPRSTYGSSVIDLNDVLAYRCRTDGYHLVPLHKALADTDGSLATAYDADGTHPNDLGHETIAREVHRYLTSVPLRVSTTPLAAIDAAASAQNLIPHALMLTGASGGGGIVADGATFTPFVFSGTCVPNIEAPAAGDGILGQWATLTATALNGNGALDFPVATQTVGDLVYLAARVKTTGTAGGCTYTVQFLTGSFTIDLLYLGTDDMDLTLMATTTRLAAVSLSKLRIQILSGTGKLWVAQPLMRNLTTLGRAA